MTSRSELVEVGRSEVHGRGVFARVPLAEGQVIEVCPVLRVSAEEVPQLDRTILYNYYFAWGEDAGIAFGFGSLYNHSQEPNASYTKLLDTDEVVITALRSIDVGQEVTLDYGWPWRTT